MKNASNAARTAPESAVGRLQHDVSIRPAGKPDNPRGHPRGRPTEIALGVAIVAMAPLLPLQAVAGPVAGDGVTMDFAVSAANVAAGKGFSVNKFVGLDKSGSAGIDVGPLGVKASGYVHAGLEFGTAVGAGTANVDMKGSVNLSTNSPLQAGQQTTINSNVVITSGDISSSASVDSLSLAAPIKFGAQLDGRLLGMKSTLVKKDWDFSLFNYTSSGPSGTPFHSGNSFFELDISRPTNFASSSGTQGSGLFQTSEYAKVARAAFDVDSVITAATGIPFGFSECLNVVVLKGCVSGDLIDLDLAINAGLRRTVAFDPTIMATYTVEDGRVFTVDANQSFSFTPLTGYEYGAYADFQVDYSFGGTGSVVTTAEVDLDLELDVLQGSVDVDYRWLSCKWLQLRCKVKWKDLVSASFGPLFEKDWTLFDKSFVLDSQQFTLAGAFSGLSSSFAIPFATAGVLTSVAWVTSDRGLENSRTTVPEPSPLLLLGGALAWLAVRRPRGAAQPSLA